MCGIAGIVSFDPRRRVEAGRLKRMCDALRHRGPDGEGVFVDGPVGLGHRRLAIVDLTGGSQPMAGCERGSWVVCNGEIYNHGELRSELDQERHPFRTRSDTEAILHLYEEDGDRCVERLRGMFAFALWDRRRKRLLLARDRLGIKPLYYAVTGEELLFASEIKAILAAGPIRAALDEAILPEFLANRFVAGDGTFFRGVRKLRPGRILTWSQEEGLASRSYWSLPAVADGSESFLAHAMVVRERLEETVRSHLMSDVPLGLFLSGGLDSTALAAIAAPMIRGPIRTFSIGFSESAANELAYARLAARSIGAEHREILLSPQEFFTALPRLVWHEDEPIAFPSSVPLHALSCLARRHVKVVLTGEGADELFLGYDRYRVTHWNDRLASAFEAWAPRPLRGALRRMTRRLPAAARRYVARTFLALESGPRSLFFENFAVFPESLQRSLHADPGRLLGADPHAEGLRCFGEGAGGLLERMGHVDLQTYLVELLMKQDQMSMAASIESRVPFLDHRFVEYVAALPARHKVRGLQTKAVLREAVRDLLPAPILTRRKMGFPVPIGGWLRGPYWPLIEELVLGPRAAERKLFDPAALQRLASEHRSGSAQHGDRLWLLLNLEVWLRIFHDGEEPDTILRSRQCLDGVRSSPAAESGVHPNALAVR